MLPFVFVAKEDFEHEIERYKVKIREMELAVSSAMSEKKGIVQLGFKLRFLTR